VQRLREFTRLMADRILNTLSEFLVHRRYTFFFILCYILFRFLPVLLVENNYAHLVENQEGSFNDKIYAVQLAYQLEKMNNLLSLNFMVNYPLGESLWNWQQVTQSFQVVVLFLFSHLFSAKVAVLVLMLIASFMSVASVRIFAQELGLNTRYVNILSILFVISPATDIAYGVHTSALFYAVPLFSYGLALKFIKSPSANIFIGLIAALALTAIIDGYHFQFAVYGTILLLAVNLRTLNRNLKSLRSRSFFYTLTFIGLVSYFFLIQTLSTISKNESRPLAITAIDVMRIHSTKISDLLTPQQGTMLGDASGAGIRSMPYLGIIMVAIMILSFFFSQNSLKNFSFRNLLILVLFTMLSSTQPSFDILDFTIPNISSLNRFLLPGVLYHSRWAQIFFVLALILLFFQIQRIAEINSLSAKSIKHKSFRKKRKLMLRAKLRGLLFRKHWLALLLLLAILDWNPLPNGSLVRDVAQIKQFKEYVKSEPFLSLPNLVQGRSWFFGLMLEAPSVNGIRDVSSLNLAVQAAQQGDRELRDFMVTRQTKFLIVILDGEFAVLSEANNASGPHYEIKRALNKEYFTKLEEIKLKMYEGQTTTFGLFRVNR
jgi:hypothetical protein